MLAAATVVGEPPQTPKPPAVASTAAATSASALQIGSRPARSRPLRASAKMTSSSFVLPSGRSMPANSTPALRLL
jgi:hypothetical protein